MRYYDDKNAEINLLAYPIIQLIIGVIRLNPVDIYYPMRLNLIALLNQLSLKTRIFIPVSNFLLEVIDCSLFQSAFHENFKGSLSTFDCLSTLKVKNLKLFFSLKKMMKGKLTSCEICFRKV